MTNSASHGNDAFDTPTPLSLGNVTRSQTRVEAVGNLH